MRGQAMLDVSIYQIAVTLTDIRPAIWRRLHVACDTRPDRIASCLRKHLSPQKENQASLVERITALPFFRAIAPTR